MSIPTPLHSPQSDTPSPRTQARIELADAWEAAVAATVPDGAGARVYAITLNSLGLSYTVDLRLPDQGLLGPRLMFRTEQLAQALGLTEACLRVEPPTSPRDRNVCITVADRHAAARLAGGHPAVNTR